MREFEQIVDDQEVVGLDIEVDFGHAPFGVGQEREIDYQRLVGVLDVAHPDIDKTMPLDYRV